MSFVADECVSTLLFSPLDRLVVVVSVAGGSKSSSAGGRISRLASELVGGSVGGPCREGGCRVW